MLIPSKSLLVVREINCASHIYDFSVRVQQSTRYLPRSRKRALKQIEFERETAELVPNGTYFYGLRFAKLGGKTGRSVRGDIVTTKDGEPVKGRRKGTKRDLGSNTEIGRKLKQYYDSIVSEEIPDRFSQLLGKLEKAEQNSGQD